MKTLSDCEVKNKLSSALYFSALQALCHFFKKLQNSESLYEIEFVKFKYPF